MDHYKKTKYCDKCGSKFLGGTTSKYCHTCRDINHDKNAGIRPVEKHTGYCEWCTDDLFKENPINTTFRGLHLYFGTCKECGDKTIIWKPTDLFPKQLMAIRKRSS